MFWTFASYFGDITFWLGAATVSMLLYKVVPRKVKKYLNWFVFALLPAVIVSYFLVTGMKFVFAIPRPCSGFFCPTDYSFPSGHAAVIFSVVTIFIMFFPRKTQMQLVLMLLAILVAYSRVALGLHRVVDVAGGAFIGIFTAVLIYINYKEILKMIHEMKFDK